MASADHQFLYRITPTRPDMLATGLTQEENRLVDEHFAYLKGLLHDGRLIIAARTLNTDPSAFGIVIFRAASLEAARSIMEADPAVHAGVFKATLWPCAVPLIEGHATPVDPQASTTSSNAVPIACRPEALTTVERERARALRADVAAAIKKTAELPSGYAFEFADDPAVFQKAAEWVSLERRCCPFLAFDLSWAGRDASMPRLAVTGPDGTKEFMAAEMPELPHGSPTTPSPAQADATRSR